LPDTSLVSIFTIIFLFRIFFVHEKYSDSVKLIREHLNFVISTKRIKKMDIKTPVSILGLVVASAFLTACCQQPQSQGGHPAAKSRANQAGNCHTHNDNAKRGTIRHCHPHVNGSNHTHNYGGQRQQVTQKQVTQRARTQNNYYYPSYDNSKRKGNYRGSVDGVIDPYAKNVMRDYRSY